MSHRRRLCAGRPCVDFRQGAILTPGKRKYLPRTAKQGAPGGIRGADRNYPKRKTDLWEPNLLRLPNTIRTELVPNNDDLKLLADQNGVTYVQVPGHAWAGAAKS
jgi:hypothetical protein